MQNHHVFALTSLAAIDAVANGADTDDLITWSFDSRAEVDAYVEASKVLREDGLGLHSFHMDGATTVFNVSLNGGVVFPRSKSFTSYLECRAFQLGCGFHDTWTPSPRSFGHSFHAHLDT